MMQTGAVLLAVAALLAVGCAEPVSLPEPILGADITRLPGSECLDGGCSIAISETRVMLRAPDETGRFVPSGIPAVDGAGRILTASAHESGQFLVWTEGGEFLQAVGSHGEGPGEMIGLVAVNVGPGDSIHVRDNQNVWSVFDQELRFVRRVAGYFGPVGYNTVLGRGEIVSGFGLRRQINVHDRDGRRIAEYGAEWDEGAEQRPPRVHVAPAAVMGQFWSMDVDRPRLRSWSVEEGLLRDYGELIGTRFPPIEEVAARGERRATPAVASVREIDGLIWIKSVVPDHRGRIGRGNTSGDTDVRFDHLIEVADPRTGRILESAVAPDAAAGFHGFVNDTLAWRRRSDDRGVSWYELVSFGLVRGDG